MWEETLRETKEKDKIKCALIYIEAERSSGMQLFSACSAPLSCLCLQHPSSTLPSNYSQDWFLCLSDRCLGKTLKSDIMVPDGVCAKPPPTGRWTALTEDAVYVCGLLSRVLDDTNWAEGWPTVWGSVSATSQTHCGSWFLRSRFSFGSRLLPYSIHSLLFHFLFFLPVLSQDCSPSFPPLCISQKIWLFRCCRQLDKWFLSAVQGRG